MSEENALPGQEVTLTAMPTVDDVIEAMKDVIDPELMVNVVDLGLVYGVNIDGEGNVTIDMTLTSPTCPLTDRHGLHNPLQHGLGVVFQIGRAHV